jgi:hypothetical protein
MTNPQMHLRNIPYRGYSLQLMQQHPQWHVLIASTQAGLPDPAPEKQTVRGWDREEVVNRAKMRVDDIIAEIAR